MTNDVPTREHLLLTDTNATKLKYLTSLQADALKPRPKTQADLLFRFFHIIFRPENPETGSVHSSSCLQGSSTLLFTVNASFVTHNLP